MLHPQQFEINEAWIVFRLNNKAIPTEQDGDLNCIALMDAASCFILASELILATSDEPTDIQFRRLLKNAKSHKQQLPKTLFIAREDAAEMAARVATDLDIEVVRVPGNELLVFIGEARQAFAERFEVGSP